MEIEVATDVIIPGLSVHLKVVGFFASVCSAVAI